MSVTPKTCWFFYYFSFFCLVLAISSSRPKTGNFAATNAVCESWNETAVEVFLLAPTPRHCLYPCAQIERLSCFPSCGKKDALNELLPNRDFTHFLCNSSLCHVSSEFVELSTVFILCSYIKHGSSYPDCWTGRLVRNTLYDAAVLELRRAVDCPPEVPHFYIGGSRSRVLAFARSF